MGILCEKRSRKAVPRGKAAERMLLVVIVFLHVEHEMFKFLTLMIFCCPVPTPSYNTDRLWCREAYGVGGNMSEELFDGTGKK